MRGLQRALRRILQPSLLRARQLPSLGCWIQLWNRILPRPRLCTQTWRSNARLDQTPKRSLTFRTCQKQLLPKHRRLERENRDQRWTDPERLVQTLNSSDRSGRHNCWTERSSNGSAYASVKQRISDWACASNYKNTDGDAASFTGLVPSARFMTGENIQKTCRPRAVKDSQTLLYQTFATSGFGQQGQNNSKLC